MNQLILGDTCQVLSVMEPKSIDLVFIDLPADIKNPSLINGKNQASKSYKKWLKNTLEKVAPVLKKTSSIFISVPTSLVDWACKYAAAPVFDKKNYKGEVRWQAPDTEGSLSVNSSLTHTSLLYFTTSGDFTYNHPNQDYTLKVSPQTPFVYRSKNPINLLKRILQYTSNEGDTLLSIGVHNSRLLKLADQQKRFWVGIDDSVKHIKSTEYQLNKDDAHPFSLRIYEYEPFTRLHGEADGFEHWVKSQFTDVLVEEASVVLKCEQKLGLQAVDQMVETHIKPFRKKWLESQESKLHGVLVGTGFSQYASEEVQRLHTYENIRLKLVTLDELIPAPQTPDIQYVINTSENNTQEVSFNLQSLEESPEAYYSWDFNYNLKDQIFRPQVMLSKQVELTQKFAPGEYTIALQTTQKDGLSSLQVLHLEIANQIEEKIAS
ncbi:MAG TPA: hypothetical protein DCS93_04075 [Microscillaceae bacterium]|nr:hypothetical protein [Microscillaceae bacterium]